MEDKLLLRPSEVAATLSIARTRCYSMLARGEIPGVLRIGRSVRVSAKALEDWVKSQTEDTA